MCCRTMPRRARTSKGDDRLDPPFVRQRLGNVSSPCIDRMASAWLIRRFIAADATFAFSAKAMRDQVPFDMPDVEFGHHGSECLER
jgi:hypothetical protein